VAAAAVTEGASKFLPLHAYGRRVFDHEWDVLVVLDACRADMYQRVVNRDADIGWSCASSSLEWMNKNFDEAYSADLADTAYVTGNPFTDEEGVRSRRDQFGLLDEVWRYGWDQETGTIPPDPITDRTITVCREHDYNRVIAHYMQPHFPFIGADRTWGHIDLNDFGGPADNPWDRCMLGETDIDEVWRAYDRNLEFVWSAVETLTENVDGTVVVTADHGNALGEWGVWGHRNYLVTPSLRRVPWDSYECQDERTYDPPEYTRDDGLDGDVDDRLRNLGYR
jgi:hypothetical protein